MAKGHVICGSLLVGLLMVGWAVPAASAEDPVKMRVQRMDGSWIVGEVEELEDSYQIRMGTGIVVTLPKSQVKAVRPLEEAEPGGAEGSGEEVVGSSFRRRIADKEIEELLEGVTIDTTGVIEGGTEMPDELPLDEESLQEMLQLAGAEHYLTKPHFVVVYTSTKSEAQRLVRRLEAVWRWNVTFMEMMGLPCEVPEHKLEVYFFGTQKEFVTHSVNTTGRPTDAGGYFTPQTNRSHFFDYAKHPFIEGRLKEAEDPRRPYKERRAIENKISRWVEYNNMAVTQHEIGHHIHFNIGLFPPETFLDPESIDALPRWFVEGMTMMFEVPPGSDGASLGVVNHGQLNTFRKLYGRHRFTPQWVKSFVVDNMEWFKGRGRGAGASYPIGWGLVYYLRREFSDTFPGYVGIISARDPGDSVDFTQREKEFVEAFGEIDEEWVDKWFEFLWDLRLKRSLLPPEDWLRP